MKAPNLIFSLLLLATSTYSSTTELTYAEGKRIFEADVWNEMHVTEYPIKLGKSAFVIDAVIKDNTLLHHINYYETKIPFAQDVWEEVIKDMLKAQFCKKPYIKSFPVILRFDLTIRKDKFDREPRLKTIIANSKDICK